MTERPSILIPYETFPVRVTFAPSDTLTPLAQLIIKAIHAGIRTVPGLDAIFGLGERPMLRLALDLMNQAMVTFNFANGEIRLTPQIVAAVENDSLATLGSLERTEERLMLMRDLIAGTISIIRPRSDPRTSARVPPTLNAGSIANVAPDDILRAVRRHLRRKTSRAGRTMHALEVAFEAAPAPGDGGGEIRYLELEVRTVYDGASDYLQILIEYPDDLSWQVRHRLEETLTRLANRRTPDDVFKNLRTKAERASEPVGVIGVRSELQKLAELVERLEMVREGTEAAQQMRLERAASEVEGVIGQYGTVATTAEIVIGDQAHVAAVKSIIQAAERQILIASPFISYDASRQFRGDIETALAADRRVFFLLGIGDDYDLPEGVGSWLYDLKRRYPERLYFSRESARCHAKFVVADAAEILLTSYNFLHRAPGEVFELGVRLRGVASPGAGRPVCNVASRVVSIARDIYADHVDSRRIIQHTGLLGSTAPAALPDSAMPRLPERGEGDGAEFTAERTALWKREWRRHAERLTRRAHSLGATFSLIRDAEHRKLMHDALRSAKRRLVIVSDQVSAHVLNREFEDELAACAQRADILLVYRRPLPGADDALARIAERCGSRVRFVVANGDEAVESHAKLLVCDDWAVATSFNFLSFAGDYEGAERHRTRTEMGVLMQGDVVGRLWERLITVIPELQPLSIPLPELAEARIPIARHDSPSRTLDDLFVELLGRHRPPDRERERRQIGLILEQWFGNARPADAFAELEELAAINAPFLEQAIAMCVAIHGRYEANTRKRWMNRLIEEMWMAGGDPHVVSLLLQEDHPDNSPAVPPLEVVLLTATCRSGKASAQSFEEAAMVRDDVANGTAVAALAIPAMLYDEDPPHEVLQYIVDTDRAPRLRGLAAKVLAFRAEHPRGLAGVDITSLSSQDALQKHANEAQKELIEELQRSVGLNANFRLGQLAWGHLLGGPTGLQAVLSAAERGDVKTIERFLAGDGRKRAGDILDDAVKEISDKVPYQNPAIEGRWRRQSVGHLEKVLRLARKWVSASASANDSGDRVPSSAVMNFARGIASDVGEVTSLADGMRAERAYPYPLVAQMLERMSPIVRLVKP